MKKTFKYIMFVFWIINVLMAFLYLLSVANLIAYAGKHTYWYHQESFYLIRTILTIPIIFVWIKTIRIWVKYDKRIPQLLLILFLTGIYSPVYYLKAVRKGWICLSFSGSQFQKSTMQD